MPILSSYLPDFLRRFLAMETAGGMVMLLAATLGLAAANSPWAADYQAALTPNFTAFVKDGLMVLFFLLIGLELKRELREGVLTKRDQVLLPLIAALGGMVVPALVFLAVNHAAPVNWAGWAIASATDIAFALCVLRLVGRHVPPALIVFLLALAIFDDVGAILVIAFFYSGTLHATAIAMAAAMVGVLFLLNRRGVVTLWPYLLAGIALWYWIHHAGVHATIAGVITGLMLPMQATQRLIHALHPWVSFLILPLFAFCSTGIALGDLTLAAARDPLPLGIALGLLIGKPLGIGLVSWLMIRLRLATLPEGTGWAQFIAVAVMAGIGFTMSLFIGALALPEAMQPSIKLGILGGSLLSAVVGGVMVRRE